MGSVHDGGSRNPKGIYLRVSRRTEMPLVAEGHRKLAMLCTADRHQLVLDKGYLFWDEPETNLNPKLIKEVQSLFSTSATAECRSSLLRTACSYYASSTFSCKTRTDKGVDETIFGFQFGENDVTCHRAIA